MRKSPQTFPNSERVQWCEQAWKLIRAELPRLDAAPEHVAITVGFPSKGARSAQKSLGECWHGWKETQKNVTPFISLHPCLFPDPVKVLGTLVHEGGHTLMPEAGHNKKFARFCQDVGLEGKPTATYPGEALARRLNAIAKKLGPILPGSGDLHANEKKQTTRLRKWVCPGCEQIIRAASDKLDVQCNPCGEDFKQEGQDNDTD